ncbi:MAG: hypothetical protein M0Z27_08520, partial [Thermaerobacter sp.]|nr:hypothetical protein [Thermaerobacter sp.]
EFGQADGHLERGGLAMLVTRNAIEVNSDGFGDVALAVASGLAQVSQPGGEKIVWEDERLP